MDRTTYLACAIIVLFVLSHCQCDKSPHESTAPKKNSTDSRYCGNSLVRAMRLICDGNYAEPNLKRSLEQPNSSSRLNRRHKIWKLKYNVKESDLITLTELDSQYQSLFGSEVHANNHLPYIGFFFKTTDDRYKDVRNRRKRDGLVRKKRGIYEECCAKPCTVTYLKRPNLELQIQHIGQSNEILGQFIGEIDFLTKRPINRHFMNTIDKILDIYAKNRLFVIWVTTSPIVITYNKEHAKRILSSNDSDILSKSEFFYKGIDESVKNSLLTIDGERWKIRRKILSVPFHTTNIDNLVKITNKESAKMVNYLKKNACKDLMIDTKKFAISLLYTLLFEYELGEEMDQAIKLSNCATDLLLRKSLSVYLISPTLYRFTGLAAEESKYANKMMEFKKKMLNAKIESSRASLESKSKNEELDGKSNNLTLIEILLKNSKKAIKDPNSLWRGFDMEEIRAQLDTFLIASVDTTSDALLFLLYHLAKYPHYQEQIYREIQREIGNDRKSYLTIEKIKKLIFLDAFINESLRYQPIVASVARQFSKDFKLDDYYTLPAGTSIVIFLEKILNDPEYFPEPRKFKPERFLEPKNDNLYTNIPFSGGPRNCVAKKTALHILALTATDIIRNFQINFAQSTPKEIDKSKLVYEILYKPIDPIELKFVERK